MNPIDMATAMIFIGMTVGLPVLIVAFQLSLLRTHLSMLREELLRIRCLLEEHWRRK